MCVVCAWCVCVAGVCWVAGSGLLPGCARWRGPFGLGSEVALWQGNARLLLAADDDWQRLGVDFGRLKWSRRWTPNGQRGGETLPCVHSQAASQLARPGTTGNVETLAGIRSGIGGWCFFFGATLHLFGGFWASLWPFSSQIKNRA